ncbi:uncharacterized protein OCT59_002725 [Rhizophagus irregularis]|uniref:uncharacterized protein n=1 Tax=Rhizophagus irregularis TaxID=588596 RepID=UPI003323EEBA|nr:hypothetical protein OCT59_002725 [Rhizophagus irregularis]
MQSDDFCDLFEERYLNWISFYTISWVQASLNILHSFISEDIWQLELIYLPFTKGFDDCLAIDT